MSGHGIAGPATWQRDERTIYSLVKNEYGTDENWFTAHVQTGRPGVGATPLQAADIARLIAAAPAMLEALKAATRWNSGNTKRMPSQEVWDMIDAAIRQAEGTDND